MIPPLTHDFIQELRQFLHKLEGTDVTELKWEDESFGFAIKRKKVFFTGKIPEKTENQSEKKLLFAVSPVVGVFHFADEKPKAGSAVKEGNELGYVEAINMKHPLELEKSGVLLEIHAHEGQPVEYGQILFTLEDVQ